MCGIAGITTIDKNINIPSWLATASLILQHRGPDDDGIVVFNGNIHYCSKIHHPQRPHPHLPYLQFINFQQIPQQSFDVGLLHRRLSVIDLSELGHQPMCTEDKELWITYNGEVYNYLEIKNHLQQKGFSFFSNSDTEVVLKAYIYWGKNFVHHLDGMWALAIYDTRTHEIILSRDRIGVKPLYYYQSKNVFAFASEQKVSLKSKLVPFNINQKALTKYLIDNVLEEDEQLFQDIQELYPSEIMTISIKNLAIQKKRYFDLNSLQSLPFIKDETKIIEFSKNIINQSIQQHLRSDVEIAVSLSGGIDSSIIAVSSAQYSNYPLHTFSIVFPQHQSIDESSYINAVSRHINSIPHHVTPQPQDFFNSVEELLYSQDIPIWSTSTYNQFLLMKNVKQQGIKVILSGQGSDELFAGYQHHYIALWFSFLSKFELLKFFKHIQNSKEFIRHPYQTIFKVWIKNYYHHKKQIISRFLSKDILNVYEHQSIHYISNSLASELIKDLSFRRLKAFLKCEDRCSMWHSIESRLPFVDNIRLTQWAFQIPDSLKLKNGVSKYILREAFKDVLPKEIYHRTDKKAFDAPLLEWMKLYEEPIKEEILNGYKEILNTQKIEKISFQKQLSKIEIDLIFKLFIISKWKNIW